MMQTAAAATSWKIAEEDQLRADLYGFLSALLAAPPDTDLLARTSSLAHSAAVKVPLNVQNC